MKLLACAFLAIAPLAPARGADGQSYSAATATRTIRIHADTTWVIRAKVATRLILKGDTLIVTADSAGTSSTATWLLGADSSRVLRYDGRPPLSVTLPTLVLMLDWEFARFHRRINTGVDGLTYEYNRNIRDFVTRIHSDTVWLDYKNGNRYRSVLRADTLAVVQKIGERTREEIWVIKGDSAHMIDRSGKIVASAPKGVVLAVRELAARRQEIRFARP